MEKFFKIIAIISMVPFLQSCFLLAAGAVGGGGYYAGERASAREDERNKVQALTTAKREIEEKQQAMNEADQNISNQINQSFVAGSLSQQIAVYPEVRGGVVILHGRVPDPLTAQRAIDAAKRTPGVTRIISNLVILNNPYPQAQPLTQYPQYIQGNQGYQQPTYLPPQGAIPPMPENLRYVPAKNQGSFNQQNDVNKKTKMAEAKKTSGKSPPNNNQQSNKAEPKPSKNPSSSSPKTLPENIINQYSDDSDSQYIAPVNYHPKAKPVQQPQPQKEVILVPVPVPYYTEDNDNLYRSLGSYNPNIAPANKNTVPLPVADPSQDNDGNLDFNYY